MPLAPLTIRDAVPADSAAVSALYADSLKANPQGFVQALAFHGDINVFARQIQEHKGLFKVACLGEKIIAIGALKRIDPAQVELCKLHVRADHQSQGYGCKLCRELIHAAQSLGYQTIQLHVTTSQQAAIRLYTRLGFRPVALKVWQGEFQGQQLAYQTQYMEMATDSPATQACTADCQLKETFSCP